MSRETTPWRPAFVLLTCEHGGREVPAAYRRLFRGAREVLASHRGSDLGALGVAQRLAARLAAPLVLSTTTRLLVELNRSRDHPDLFSEYTRGLSREQKEAILAAYYAPYRASVETTIGAAVSAGHVVLHLGVHSCADVLDGRRRDLDTALLFDPQRPGEASFADRWRAELRREAAGLRHRFNEPYLGTDDGLTTTLRTKFPAAAYAGIEIEVRQGLIHRAREQRTAGDLLATTIARVI